MENMRQVGLASRGESICSRALRFDQGGQRRGEPKLETAGAVIQLDLAGCAVGQSLID